MIKVIKIDDLIYTNIEPFYIYEKGNKHWNIPNDLETLRKCTIDTFNWLIGQEIKNQSGGDNTKLPASNSKAIALLVKVIMSLNPDTSKLTQLEKSALDKMKALADNGYADSELLNKSLDAVLNNISVYSQKIELAQQAQTIDELIALLS